MRRVLGVCLLALLAVAVAASPLSDLDDDLAMLEAEAGATPSSTDILTEAQNYAASKLAAAKEESSKLLAAAAEQGRQEAVAPEKATTLSPEARDKLRQQAQADAAQIAQQNAKKAAERAARRAARAAAQEASGIRSQNLRANKQGVYGAVNLGPSKIETLPSSVLEARAAAKATDRRSALRKFEKFGDKTDIYGRTKSCLKDIAAHFDEQDIYEAKKLALIQKIEYAKSARHAVKLRRKLANLESWHQMMQRKFMMSAKEGKKHEAYMQKLFDAHLPKQLKDQLTANKAAKAIGKPLPFPHAHEQAMKVLRQKRKQIQRDERLRDAGHKRIILPEINDPDQPSADPISAYVREKQWRAISTESEWSTDGDDLKRAEAVVASAHKTHEDFMESPNAQPLLRDRVYTAETEALGRPDFLGTLPPEWRPSKPEQPDDSTKVKVEQTYFTTY